MAGLVVEVRDTLAELRPLFLFRGHARERFALAQQTVLSPNGVIGQLRRGRDFDIRAAVLRDGYAAIFGQQAWGMFDPRRTVEASEWQFQRFGDLDMTERIRAHLEDFAAHFEGPRRVTCVAVPIDPASPLDMIGDQGLSCYAGAPGQIVVALWPSDGNVARLGPALARALALNVEWAAAASRDDASPPKLGEVLRIEGAAAAFVAERFPDLGEPCLQPFRPPPDHEAALEHAAGLLGLSRYAELRGNVYGALVTAADVPSPVVEPMDEEMRAYAWQVIEPLLSTTDAVTIAGCLYGDALVAAAGHPSLGLPAYAGFQLALSGSVV